MCIQLCVRFLAATKRRWVWLGVAASAAGFAAAVSLKIKLQVELIAYVLLLWAVILAQGRLRAWLGVGLVLTNALSATVADAHPMAAKVSLFLYVALAWVIILVLPTVLPEHATDVRQVAPMPRCIDNFGEEMTRQEWEEGGGFAVGDCAICLESCSPLEAVRGLPCGHAFHASCAERWVTHTGYIRAIPRCPICRAPACKGGKELDTLDAPPAPAHLPDV